MGEETETGVEQWDLTSMVAPFLDRHMMFPLLEYLDTLIGSGAITYSTDDIAAARLALLRPTHMVDYAIDIYKGLHGENVAVPPEMEQQKTEVYQRLEELRKGCKPLDELCQNKEERVRRTYHVAVSSCLFEISYSPAVSFCTCRFVFRRNWWPLESGTWQLYQR